MFTPEGYWSWHELCEAAKDWTEQIVIRSIMPKAYFEDTPLRPYKLRQDLHEKLVSSGKAENHSEARFAMELMELWVLATFMDLYEAVLCSPDGRTLRCPPILKAHADGFEYWSWPLSNEKVSHGEAGGYFEFFRAGSFGIADSYARFVAIDHETGDIRLKANTRRLLQATSYNLGGTDDSVHKFIDEQIRPLIGWSICWDDEVFPETERDLFVTLGFVDLDWTDVDDVAPQNSDASSYKNIVACVLEAYPSGKGTAIWDEVENKAGYSRRSIVRALKAEGAYSTWAKGGHTQ